MLRILFITTANLSSNPRLLKEIQFAKSFDCDIQVVAFHLGGWSDEQDQEIIKKLNLRIAYLSAFKKPFLSWLIGSLVHQISHWVWPCVKNCKRITAYAISKRSFLLFQFFKKNRDHYNLVIAHNLGALYPAWWYSRKHDIPFNFDVEDYYPGEKVDRWQTKESELRLHLMRQLMPDATYNTYAAPLIGKKILEEIDLDKNRFILVNNSFYKGEFIQKENSEQKKKDRVNLVWFSQKIGYHRGLEPLIRSLSLKSKYFSLTLIGWMDPSFHREYLAGNKGFITCLDPLPQEELHRRLGEYDAGLAVEDPSSDANRDICLTNKIWAYYLSGLFILATDTSAQHEFLEIRKDHGKTFNSATLEDSLVFIQENIESIREKSKKRQSRALKESFEAEIPKLEKTWEVKEYLQ